MIYKNKGQLTFLKPGPGEFHDSRPVKIALRTYIILVLCNKLAAKK